MKNSRLTPVVALLFLVGLSQEGIANPFKRDIAREGNEAYGVEDFPKALSEYLKAQDLEPLSAAVRYNLGAAYFAQEEYEKAIEEFSEATRADEIEVAASAYYNLGNARYKNSKRNFQAASAQAAQAAGPIPGATAAPATEADPVHEYVGKLEECIADYEEALKRDSEDVDAKYNIEMIRREIKNLMRRDEQENQDQQQQQDENQEQQENQDQQDQQDQQQQQDQEQQQSEGEQEQEEGGEEEATPTPQPQSQDETGTPTPQAPQSPEESDEDPEEAPTPISISEEMARNILDNLPEHRPRNKRPRKKDVEKDW